MSLPKVHNEELFSASNELPGFLSEDDPMMVFGRVVFPQFTDKDCPYRTAKKLIAHQFREIPDVDPIQRVILRLTVIDSFYATNMSKRHRTGSKTSPRHCALFPMTTRPSAQNSAISSLRRIVTVRSLVCSLDNSE